MRWRCKSAGVFIARRYIPWRNLIWAVLIIICSPSMASSRLQFEGSAESEWERGEGEFCVNYIVGLLITPFALSTSVCGRVGVLSVSLQTANFLSGLPIKVLSFLTLYIAFLAWAYSGNRVGIASLASRTCCKLQRSSLSIIVKTHSIQLKMKTSRRFICWW